MSPFKDGDYNDFLSFKITLNGNPNFIADEINKL